MLDQTGVNTDLPVRSYVVCVKNLPFDWCSPGDMYDTKHSPDKKSEAGAIMNIEPPPILNCWPPAPSLPPPNSYSDLLH